TDKVKVQAVEDIGDRPVRIQGRVLTSVTMREGPGDQFDAAGTLQAGREVTIIGKTRNDEWLLLDIDGGRWVPSTAIEPLDSIELVPIKEPTPTPQPSPTNTPEPSPTASPTPDSGPDFVPMNAILIDGGRALRVTVANQSTENFSGVMVVSATGVGAAPPSKAFDVTLPANSSTTVDFDLDPPLTTQKPVTIKVDPDNVVKEANEDNNVATIPLLPPVEEPNLQIQSPTISASSISVVVRNTGGDMETSDVVLQVQVQATGESVQSGERRIALAKGQSETLTVSRPQGTGTATLTVLVNGTPMGSVNIELG
ncbi:MAG: CARDB domain-containing protein, partial [Ignavibacteriales bacterium]